MKKTWQKICVTILLVLIAVASVYFLVFDKVTLVYDKSFSINMELADIKGFRSSLLRKGARLSIRNLDSEDFLEKEQAQKFFASLNTSDVVVLSPVATALTTAFDINLSEMLQNTIVAGISDSSNGKFDIVLKSEKVVIGEGEVDYRFYLSDLGATTIVIPDLTKSVLPLLDLSKSELNREVGVLYYEKREIR